MVNLNASLDPTRSMWPFYVEETGQTRPGRAPIALGRGP